MYTSDKNDQNIDNITLSEAEIEKISKLYQTALEFTSSDQLGVLSDTKKDHHSESDQVNKKQKAWHEVKSYLEELGKKYNYDPEKYVINKITRKLEPYNPKS